MKVMTRSGFQNQYGDKIEHPFRFWSLGLVYYNKTINLNLLWWGFGLSWRNQERTDSAPSDISEG